jgi:phosphoserine phosphatase
MLPESQFSQLLMQLYMKTDFQVPAIPMKIGHKVFLSSFNQYGTAKKKKFITDFDGVFEVEGTEPLYRLFFKHLHDDDINPAIDRNQIDSYIRSIFEGTPINEVFKQMTEYFKSDSIRLTRKQYYEACKRAVDEWIPNPEAWKTIEKLREMGYSITIISGSVQEALETAAKKIDISKKRGDEIIGTEFKFDIFGRLEAIDHMLGEEKLKEKKRITRTEKHIAMTDDMVTDDLITYGAQLSVVVADKDDRILETQEQIYIFDKSVRNRFSVLVDYVKKFEYSAVRSYRTSVSKERRIVSIIQKIKVTESKEEFLEMLELLATELEIFNPFSLAEKIQLILNYKNDTTEKQKTLKQEILTTLEELPEYVNTEAFVELLKAIE